MRSIPLLLVLYVLFRAPAAAAPPDTVRVPVTPTMQAEAGIGYDHLGGGFQPWSESYVRLHYTPRPRAVLSGSFSRTERFGQPDVQLGTAAALPLGRQWNTGAEVRVSPTRRVLPGWSAAGWVGRGLGAGWVAQLGAGRRSYTEAAVLTGHATLERYWGSNRAAYTLAVGDGEEIPLAASHLFQWSRDLGGGNAITVGVAAGREAERLDAGRVLVTPVRAASVWGTARLTPRWDATYALGIQEQGSFYTRRTLQIGVRTRF